MKLNFFNDRLNDLSCNGSFTVCSRELSLASQELGIYASPKEADYIIFMDAFDVERKIDGRPVIPFVMSEYNVAFNPMVQRLIKNNTFCFSISDQSTKSFINAGLPENLIKTVHLGGNSKAWINLNRRNRKFSDPLIYITNNSSNNRSGYNDMIPAWLEFAQEKNVRLIIKDQENPKFRAILNELDKEKKITYIGDNLSYEKLLSLYNQCHIGLYINSCTSFGLTILEKALCGLPMIVSKASSIPEFTSEETVNYVECDEILVDHMLTSYWNSWGLKNNLPDLNLYSKKLLTFRPRYQSILEKLEYSYKNYEKMLAKNQKFVDTIKSELTWVHSVKKIVNILKDKK